MRTALALFWIGSMAIFTACGEFLALLQAAPTQAVPVVQVSPSEWTPALVTGLVTVVFAGLATLIGSMAALYQAVKSMKKENKEGIDEQKAATAQVHTLVNAGNSALLEQVARLTRRVSEISGRKEDIEEADAAEYNVSEKARITAEADIIKGASVILAAEKKKAEEKNESR